MPFINRVLEPPSYGWKDQNGHLIVPTKTQLLEEFLSRINIFRTRKNWLQFSSWVWAFGLTPFLIAFIFWNFNWWLVPVAFVYSMVIMGSHGTVWYHRYATHRAFKFSNQFWRFITQNLVIKVIPEEGYVVSHHVHHLLSDQPGDPYNAQGGGLYCFLADANHQPIALDLDKEDYNKASLMLMKTGIKINSYAQYLKWGTISHPFWSWFHVLANWAFWYFAFYMIGGHGLATALFAGAQIWAFGVRTFNFEGHGSGEDLRKEGMDFSLNDRSINQYWPGIVAGEWHSNHHLYPNSARNGFTKSQIDIPWYYIKFLHLIGGVKSYRNDTEEFFEKFYNPHLEEKKLKKMAASSA